MRRSATHSASVASARRSAVSTCSAAIVPSPVVWQSRHSRWPELSPPYSQPRACICSST
ncbi:Uncharacterised protein [Bordetella pertussis]|nr:Uncharacterised protein [Bordetella pertussis]